MIGFCSSPRFVGHDTGPHHPERPDRIRVIHAALHKAGLIGANPFPDFSIDLGPLPSFAQPLVEITPAPADERWLRLVHPRHHIDHIRHVCSIGGGVLDLGDTPVCPASFDLALLSAGGVLSACDAVITGAVRRAFAAGRPPGHHAEPDRAMGFCLFANVAIAARYLQKHHGLERIAIVDFDVHHGNGTQACLENDPSILFLSLHQDPHTCYPGSGHEWEIGTGAGRGHTVNLPLAPGSTDADYLKVIDARVIPELDRFRPDVLLISAGFDAHAEDPLAHMELSEEGFELITRALCAVADQHCHGRVISALEGGYNLRALGRSVVRHLVGMSET